MSDMGTKGFTLIEVLIIIAIVGILTTIAVMNFSGIIDSYKARGAASQLYSEMQMARLRAIKEGKAYALEFVGTQYCIKSCATCKESDDWDTGCDIGGEDTVDTIIKTIDMSSDYSGINFCDSSRAAFYPNGTGSGGGVIIYKGAKYQKVYISSKGTGNIRIVTAACP